MRYQVVWEQACFEELEAMLQSGAPIWILTTAVRQIAEQLSINAFDAGRELAEELRIIDVPPLRAYFIVEPLDGIVKVTFVRLVEQGLSA